MATATEFPQQLSFSWDESSFVGTEASHFVPTVVAPSRSARQSPSVGSSASPVRKRGGNPKHISDLMVAVLARYGIDPNEFTDCDLDGE